MNLADLFEVVVDTVPDRLALVAGDARRTYRELDERANRFAHHLVDEAGVEPGEWIAIYSWNRVEWFEAMLGAFKARAVPVNVNYRYVADELRHILHDSGAVYAVLEPEFAPLLERVRPDLPALRGTLEIGDAYERALAASPPTRDGLGPRSADDLYVLYTGGTTGMPKGVEWRQEDIFFAALGGGGFGQPPIAAPEELAGRVTPDDDSRLVHLVLPPMMHGGGQWISFITMFGGGTVVLWTGRHLDAHEVWRIAEREGAHAVMVVGDAMARPLAEALADGTHDTSKLFLVASGGAFLSAAVKAQLRERLPNVMIVDSFGASETGAGGSVLEGDAPRFVMGEFMTVLGDDLRPVAPGSGVVGRLARRGHIPLGYHNDPAKTAATFVTAADGIRWVVPGDAATIEADGTITVLGRGSVSINTGGEKVFPEEVEAALKSHPEVFDAIVVGVPDETFGERVAAIVEPRDAAAPPTLASLQAHARERIAGYKVPRELRIVDAMPRTPVGKADYRAAKALFSA